MNLQRIKCVPQLKNMVNINMFTMFTVNRRSVEGKYLDIREGEFLSDHRYVKDLKRMEYLSRK